MIYIVSGITNIIIWYQGLLPSIDAIVHYLMSSSPMGGKRLPVDAALAEDCYFRIK